jgi:hypothetical protein
MSCVLTLCILNYLICKFKNLCASLSAGFAHHPPPPPHSPPPFLTPRPGLRPYQNLSLGYGRILALFHDILRVHYGLFSTAAAEAKFMNVHSISLSFLGIILSVLRFEISVYSVYNTSQFKTTFAGGGGGGVKKAVSRGDSE